MNVEIRWMIMNDLDRVLEIERDSFAAPMESSEFRAALRKRNTIGVVAETYDRDVIGFAIYELHTQYLLLRRLAVDAPFRWNGVGREFVEKLKRKLSHKTPGSKRNTLSTFVGERNLPAQLFFRACGFRAVDIVSPDSLGLASSDEDYYEMEFRITFPSKGKDTPGSLLFSS